MEFNETSSKPIELFKAIANLFIAYLNYVNSQFQSQQANQVHHETEYSELSLSLEPRLFHARDEESNNHVDRPHAYV